MNQEVAVGLLQLRGHRVSVANNGREALEATQRERFDVVLMDIEMPEMDGLEAAGRIRALERAAGEAEGAVAVRRVPIIAMTAHAVPAFREKCFAAEMDGYLAKPIQPVELYAALDEVARA